MLIFQLLTALILLLFAQPSEARHIPIWNSEHKIFYNLACEKNDTCDLKTFSFLKEDFSMTRNSLAHYATRAFAEYETSSIETLTNYGIVKFIRGCKFESRLVAGVVLKEKTISKMQFGDGVLFHFPQWVIDSIDKDPIYPSLLPVEDEEVRKNRHHFYRWNPRGLHDRKTEKVFGEEEPPYPRLYIADIPGAAYLWDENFDLARNVSLELKSCIYKIGDIPLKTAQDDIDFAKPIHCFSWQSSFIYNFDLGKFETTAELDPFCLEEQK